MSNQEFSISPNDNSNYFFGFHDLIAWNNDETKLATLKINNIKSPPSIDTPCTIGYIEKGEFIELGKTNAYNYPQGARQQWIGDTNVLIVNNKVGEVWGTDVYDTDKNELIDSINFTSHVVTNNGWAFGLDYSRLHRVGGYGYTGILDVNSKVHAPMNSGIIKHNIFTKENELILSIYDVANFKARENLGKHHYITHLVLNPSQTRIAFLHRCKLNDGGETTRLMTVDINGENLRCLATGFLSHFDWKDDGHVAIWGRVGTGIEKLRSNPIIRMIPPVLMRGIKEVVKKLLKKDKLMEDVNIKKASPFDWLLFSDSDQVEQTFLGKGVLLEDGHPMFCPSNRDWLINDTYPNNEGIRELYLFQYSTQKKVLLGRYKMIFEKPDIDKIKNTLEDVEQSVLKSFSVEKMAFYRSGLHCDLHPRWKRSGKTVAFDSIHEGKRRIYGFEVDSYINQQ
ncbi:hypothetical protein ACFQ5N_10310 [Lutibacter holmesii]|uniref:Uncharacterized protein n=1 Tax=Lutibacter holmesii TaxID=1137985 RepID=A0ABW3WPZ4_9FLAO